MPSLLTLASLLLLPVTAIAQTASACNPTLRTDCPVNAALGTNATFDFTKYRADLDVWTEKAGKPKYMTTGADFVISGKGYSPTITSKFHIFFGRVSILMRASTGNAVISSIMLLSDDLDEIDWEIRGQDTNEIQTNYYGKGDNTTLGRGGIHRIDANPSATILNYTLDWTKEKLDWILDGKVIRTLKYGDAAGGTRYPQTPMTVNIGNWVAGDPEKNAPGVMEWAGGVTDFSKTPFIMTVASVFVEDYSSGKSYKYGDKTGSWESIVIEKGESQAAVEIYSPKGVSGRWGALPKGAQVGIIAGALSVFAVIICLIAFCCVKQRRAGRKERANIDAEYARGQAELMEYKRRMADDDYTMPATVAANRQNYQNSHANAGFNQSQYARF